MPDTAHKKTSRDSRAAYIKVAKRLFDGIEARCALTREDPSVTLLVSQMAIRTRLLATSTMNAEISAIRFVLKEVIKTETWEHMGDLPQWVMHFSSDQVERLMQTTNFSRAELAEISQTELDKVVDLAQGFDPQLSREEVITSASHTASKGLEKLTNKGRKSVTWNEYLGYEIAFGSEDSQATLSAIRAGKYPTKGMLKLFVAGMFLCGMRPIEVWNCAMLVPDPSLAFDNDMRKLIYANPHEAIAKRFVIPVEDAAETIGVSITEAAKMASQTRTAPIVFAIKSAKQANANETIQADYRLLVFDNLQPHDIATLAMTAQLRHLNPPEKYRQSSRSMMLQTLKAASREAGTSMRSDTNLYSFRHAFVDRVRRVYDPYEAAAMSGHTSKVSLYAYGESRTRKGRAPSSGIDPRRNAVPKPDQALVVVIKAHWSNDPEMGAFKAAEIPDISQVGFDIHEGPETEN